MTSALLEKDKIPVAAGEDDLAEETSRSMRAAEKRVMDQLVREFSLEELFPEGR